MDHGDDGRQFLAFAHWLALPVGERAPAPFQGAEAVRAQPQGTRDQRDDPLDRRLALLLAMAMFVLVVDTSIMNVSISAVVRDLGTTVSGVQSAIA